MRRGREGKGWGGERREKEGGTASAAEKGWWWREGGEREARRMGEMLRVRIAMTESDSAAFKVFQDPEAERRNQLPAPERERVSTWRDKGRSGMGRKEGRMKRRKKGGREEGEIEKEKER